MHIRRAVAKIACLIAAALPVLGAGNGLRGDYFNNTGLVGTPVVSRTDTTVDFTWSGAPASGMSGDHFSARWSGKLEAPVTGAYTLAVNSDEGIRVWLNNALVIDNWAAHAAIRNASAPINLVAAQQYTLKIEYYERTGSAVAQLLWSYPGQAEIAVPEARLYSDTVTTMASSTYLSGLTPVSSTNGEGPYERDLSNGNGGEGDGKTITIGGTRWARGLGVSAASELVYQLSAQYQTFLADIGVDDEVSDRGSVVFEVWLDGVRKYQSPVLRGYDRVVSISVPVVGGNELKLAVTNGGDGNGYDRADWAGARVVNQTMTTPPVAPTTPTILPAPSGFAATAGNRKVSLKWNTVAGALGYRLYRSTVQGQQGVQLGGILIGMSYEDIGVTNGTTYFYRMVALNQYGPGAATTQVSAKPFAPAPAKPTGLAAVAGDKLVTLNWTAADNATTYNLYRSTTSGGQGTTPVRTGITGTTFTDTGLTNGTTYYYKIAGVGEGGTSPQSSQVSGKPAPPPLPSTPGGVSATPGNGQVMLSWNTTTNAVSYNLFRGTTSNGQGDVPVRTGLTGVTFTDTGLTNGQTYYYRVAAVNVAGQQGSRSSQVNATPFAPAMTLTSEQMSAFKFLRQSTWGPTIPLVDRVVQIGKPAFIEEQFALPATPYPDALIAMPNMELVSEQFFQNALQGPDQLRQRVAWALSQIWVASAIKVDNTHAMVPYIRILEEGAFGNVREVLEQVTLSPAMGEFLDMVNNKKADPTKGTMPNENYARELMQLFTIGLADLNEDGSPTGAPSYGQEDILELSRVLSGWTYGDAVAGDPTKINKAFYEGPMEPVAAFHDAGQKVVLGETFPAGQSARLDLKQALDLLFNHKNMPPLFAKHMIQRLVKSNPSPAYINAVVQAFKNNGQGVRGDMKAIVRAVLLHPEAEQTPDSGKFSEPALFLLTLARGLNSTVTDHPYLTDFSQDMGQRIWFAPSVFNYFSPGYRLNGVLGPELQIWSTATAMTRTNFVASLVSGGFGSNFAIDTTPYLPYVGNNAALVDTANARLMGGKMGAEMRSSILTALGSATSNTDRIRTVLYLIGSSMQYQVEH